jgi:four helix bundle protein
MGSDHQQLEVWQEAMGWVTRVYKLTTSLPDSERFGLISQLQRAAVSVPANIAEGAARDSTKDFLRHLSIAQGSAAESDTVIQIAIQLEYLSKDRCSDLLDKTVQIRKMLSALQRSLRDKVSQ